MACTTADKLAWSAAIGLPICIADAFCVQYDRLPASMTELNTWGTSTGYRLPDGTWTCTPSGGTQPPPGGGTQPPPGSTTPTEDALTSLFTWVTKHPLEAALGATVAWFVVKKR